MIPGQLSLWASEPLVDESESWRRGRDWLLYAPGLRPDPADLLFAPAGSPNLGFSSFPIELTCIPGQLANGSTDQLILK